MALVQSTFSQAWEDSCKLCFLVILVSGHSSICPCTMHNDKTPQFVHSSYGPKQSLTMTVFHSCFCRVRKDCLAFSPLLPNDISELCIRGVNYMGHQMDWLLRTDEVCLILREQESRVGNTKPYDLQVVLKASGTKIPLTPGS